MRLAEGAETLDCSLQLRDRSPRRARDGPPRRPLLDTDDPRYGGARGQVRRDRPWASRFHARTAPRCSGAGRDPGLARNGGPLAPRGTARGPTSRSSRARDGGGALSLRPPRRRPRGRARPAARAHRQIWHAYLPDVRPGPALWLPGARALGPRGGHRFNPAKLLLDPYAKAISGTIHWSDALFGYSIGAEDQRISSPTRATARACCPSAWSSTGLQLGRRQAAAHAVERHRHLRVPREGFDQLHPEVPETLRGTYLGLAHDPMIDSPPDARRHRGGAAAHPPLRRRAAPRRQGLTQLLGLQHARLLRARRALRRRGLGRRRSPSSRPW